MGLQLEGALTKLVALCRKKKKDILEMDYHERKKAFILQHQDEFPERVRRAIREASLEKPEVFLREVKHSVETCCCLHLNDETDTQQAVELAIRCFPEFLGIELSDSNRNWDSTRNWQRWQREGCRLPVRPVLPIRHIARLSQSVSFVPLFAKIAIDMQIFEDYRRGGLFPKSGSLDDSVFSLLGTCKSDDTKYLAVIRELHESNLMTKADIPKYHMIESIGDMKYTYQRFRYLLDWDPSLLVPGKFRNHNLLPGDIHSMTALCELSLTVYPNELGFLFDPVYFVGEIELISLYKFGCDKYGNGYMQGILNTFVCAQMKKDPSFTRKAVVRAATREFDYKRRCRRDYYKAGVQSIFCLLQQDPTLLCNQHYRAIPSKAQFTKP